MTKRAYLQLLSADTQPVSAEVRLEESFRDNARYVHAIALRILGREDEVEDLLQDLFIAAQKDLRDLSQPAAVRGWFATATVRLARRRLSRRKWFSFFGDEDYGYENAIAPDADPEQRALLASIYKVLDRLPVATRLAWTLRNIEGMQLETVAEMCNCSLATAKRRITAAHELIEETVRDV